MLHLDLCFFLFVEWRQVCQSHQMSNSLRSKAWVQTGQFPHRFLLDFAHIIVWLVPFVILFF
jgi:hypothetical protein